mmetsp:Transcript_27730/g.75015  ORF Transcript_27730/g.75015 Transcript_27730/m.75015 type:complete len:447 (-) Transcript_27730:84-1424(-)
MDTLMMSNTTLMPKDYDHKGPNQAGNKSLLSYRSDIGVPGYTGHIAAPQQVVLPIKCGTHVGKEVDDATHDKATLETLHCLPARSQYAATFHKKPQDTQPCRKSGGGYWIPNRDAQKPATAPFLATTTYRAEVLNGSINAEDQLGKSDGLKCTLAPYEVARNGAHRLRSTGTRQQEQMRTSTTRPDTVMTSAGELVGYQTTNDARLAYAKSPEDMHKKRPVTVPGDMRYSVLPRAMAPGMFGATSSYGQDYGPDTSDPMERAAPAEKFQTRLATTRDLAEGTSRNTNNVPGYTGHVASSQYNRLARAQSDAPDERSNFKNDMLLFHLDQYNRSRIPHYTGYRPQAPRNITLEQPSQGPTKATTMGAANAQASKYGIPPIDNTHYINSRTGLMDFFTSGGLSQSDNGLHSAQTFYKSAPPVDGGMRHAHLPRVTHYGKKFDNRNSLV